MHLDDLVHRLGIGKLDVMEEAAAQEGIRQLFFIVGGDDQDWALLSLDRFACLIDKKLHAIEFEQQIVRKLDVSLVDFVNQQHRPLRCNESIPQFAALDVVADIGHAVDRQAGCHAGARRHRIHTSPAAPLWWI